MRHQECNKHAADVGKTDARFHRMLIENSGMKRSYFAADGQITGLTTAEKTKHIMIKGR